MPNQFGDMIRPQSLDQIVPGRRHRNEDAAAINLGACPFYKAKRLKPVDKLNCAILGKQQLLSEFLDGQRLSLGGLQG